MVLSFDRWVGKVAIVTGTSSGIGAAIVEQLVSNGVIVAGLARRVDRTEQLAKQFEGQKGKLHAIKADITNEDELLAAFKWVNENLGPVHILINNAGVTKPDLYTEGKTEDWKAVFDLNVLALSIATREAVKIMRANNIDGHIININSGAGHRVANIPAMNVYPASKFAVTALTETLRQELNHLGLKIRVTSVSPGLVESEMTTLSTHERGKKLREFVKGWSILKSEDIADSVIYVLSTPPHVQVHELSIRPVGQKI